MSIGDTAGLGSRNALATAGGAFGPGTMLQIQAHSCTVKAFLASGGNANVYTVSLISDGSMAVLKHVLFSPDEPEHILRVENEIRVMSQLSGHPNIVPLIASEVSNECAFILMEYCKGDILSLMNSILPGKLDENTILNIFSDVCKAVAHMHYQTPPIIHRDLKVENILVSDSGYKLCDFGSATSDLIRPRTKLTREKIVLLEEELQQLTTLEYRAPEMIDLYLQRGVNESADIWALGVLLYKLCYFATPFDNASPLAILNAEYSVPPQPAYSKSLKHIFQLTLREEPRERSTIYTLYNYVCRLRNVHCDLANKYNSPPASPSVVSATNSTGLGAVPRQGAPQPRRYAASSTKSQSNDIFVRSTQDNNASMLDTLDSDAIVPMRRGRPTRHNKPSVKQIPIDSDSVFAGSVIPLPSSKERTMPSPRSITSYSSNKPRGTKPTLFARNGTQLPDSSNRLPSPTTKGTDSSNEHTSNNASNVRNKKTEISNSKSRMSVTTSDGNGRMSIDFVQGAVFGSTRRASLVRRRLSRESILSRNLSISSTKSSASGPRSITDGSGFSMSNPINRSKSIGSISSSIHMSDSGMQFVPPLLPDFVKHPPPPLPQQPQLLHNDISPAYKGLEATLPSVSDTSVGSTNNPQNAQQVSPPLSRNSGSNADEDTGNMQTQNKIMDTQSAAAVIFEDASDTLIASPASETSQSQFISQQQELMTTSARATATNEDSTVPVFRQSGGSFRLSALLESYQYSNDPDDSYLIHEGASYQQESDSTGGEGQQTNKRRDQIKPMDAWYDLTFDSLKSEEQNGEIFDKDTMIGAKAKYAAQRNSVYRTPTLYYDEQLVPSQKSNNAWSEISQEAMAQMLRKMDEYNKKLTPINEDDDVVSEKPTPETTAASSNDIDIDTLVKRTGERNRRKLEAQNKRRSQYISGLITDQKTMLKEDVEDDMRVLSGNEIEQLLMKMDMYNRELLNEQKKWNGNEHPDAGSCGISSPPPPKDIAKVLESTNDTLLRNEQKSSLFQKMKSAAKTTFIKSSGGPAQSPVSSPGLAPAEPCCPPQKPSRTFAYDEKIDEGLSLDKPKVQICDVEDDKRAVPETILTPLSQQQQQSQTTSIQPEETELQSEPEPEQANKLINLTVDYAKEPGLESETDLNLQKTQGDSPSVDSLQKGRTEVLADSANGPEPSSSVSSNETKDTVVAPEVNILEEDSTRSIPEPALEPIKPTGEDLNAGTAKATEAKAKNARAQLLQKSRLPKAENSVLAADPLSEARERLKKKSTHSLRSTPNSSPKLQSPSPKSQSPSPLFGGPAKTSGGKKSVKNLVSFFEKP